MVKKDRSRLLKQCHNMKHYSKPCKRSPYLPKIGTEVGEKSFLGNFPQKIILPKARSKLKNRFSDFFEASL